MSGVNNGDCENTAAPGTPKMFTPPIYELFTEVVKKTKAG